MFPVSNLIPLKKLNDLWTPESDIQESFNKHWVHFSTESKNICDLIFVCDNCQEIYASKNVLASRSVLFKNKYFGSFFRNKTDVDTIYVQYPRNVVQYAVLWCFTGTVPWCLNPCELAKLFHFCSYYDLHELTDLLVASSLNYFEKNPNILIFFILHQQLFLTTINLKLKSFIIKPTFFSIVEEGLMFDLSLISKFTFPGAKSPEIIFNFVVSWFNYKYPANHVSSENGVGIRNHCSQKCRNILIDDEEYIILSKEALEHLRSMQHLLNFNDMSESFVLDVVSKTNIYCDEEISNIIRHLHPEKTILQRLTRKEAKLLDVGSTVDHRDNVGRFLPATIIENDKTNGIWKLHYPGWNSKFDVTIKYKDEINNLAPNNSLSCLGSKNLSLLKKDDHVKVYVEELGWVSGEIRKFHNDKRTNQAISAQVQVAYRHPSYRNKRLQWFHIDNEDEFHWETDEEKYQELSETSF